ncbi:MAG: rhodanese-like domain-containing protein [Candidatus Pacebacteria bacterium]|nr:rhodanese-like domain-containing protein [Candidatus Paceibacterota bacterium]MCD8507834.1 rhodanese-like domain-containing protein [Candidatus Paceibacterota bacterium]MCD8528127.1 rhodanese-like domain-containing protein [Candidatus Paceibacterota bacterium]MCD8563513.1 rhodanese-like domain-containing protein [Candidatus Paceibacterota bacterium]
MNMTSSPFPHLMIFTTIFFGILIGTYAFFMFSSSASESDSYPLAQDTRIFELLEGDDFMRAYENHPQGILIDIRTPAEFAAGAIPEARLINMYDRDFITRIHELDRHEPYFIYCNSGNRSASVMALMQDMGFQHVYELAGGIVDNRHLLQ